jgi:pilus assembly protein CpaB
MKPKTLILMLVAVGCGLVAAYLATSLTPKASDSAGKIVWVAKTDLPPGTVLKDPVNQLEQKRFSEESFQPEMIQDPNLVKDKRLSRGIDKGMPVTNKDVSGAQDLFKYTPSSIKDPRAMTIPVDNIKALAGFLLPNSKVDLLLTSTDNKGRRSTQTFMEVVHVLAVNTMTEQPKDGSTVPPANTITVAVSPEDAQRIILAMAQGQISVNLRRFDDDKKVKPKPTIDPTMEGGEGGPGLSKDAPTIKVWIPKKTMNPGTKVTDADFELMSWPRDLARNALTEKDNVRGELQNLALAGYPLTRAHYVLGAIKEDGGKNVVTYLWVHEGLKKAKPYKYVNGVFQPDGDEDEASKATTPEIKPKGPSEGPTEK